MTGLGPACVICNARFEATLSHCPNDGAPLRPSQLVVDDPHPGMLVLGKYQIEQLIGWGAMGKVYRALQHEPTLPCAVKLLHRGLAGDEKLVHRFNREARIASQLDHPNIIEIYDHGLVMEPTGTALPALVMELVPGRSLRSVLAQSEHGLSPARALDIVGQIAAAVAHAHERGIVHRDLKPANVMLVGAQEGGPERVKVLDFGLAKSTLEPGSHPTVTGTVLGTPHYLSPEAALGEPITPAGDVYSLAVVLFECLAKRPPFNAPNPISVMVQHTSQEPPRLDAMPGLATLPQALVELVARNLRKNPGERDANATELSAALDDIARKLDPA